MPPEEKKFIEVIAQPEKSIPKYSTNVNFSKLRNNDIIITFLARPAQDGPATLIETIIVDEEHAKKIVEVLSQVINKTIDE